MKNYIIVLFISLQGIMMTLSAQPKCEFDLLYPKSKVYGSGGMNVIQLKDGGFAISGFTSEVDGISGPHYYTSTVIKIDRCGNLMWQYDDSTVFSSIPFENGLIEEEDNSITFITDNQRLIKLDKNGNRKWKIKISTDTNLVNNSILKVATNRYLLAGKRKVALYKTVASILMIDSLGNSIFQKDYFVNSSSNSFLTKLYRKSISELILLGFENDGLMIVGTDIDGNTNSIHKKFIQDSLTDQNSEKMACLNSDLNEILYSATRVFYKLFAARLNLAGDIIKDTTINYFSTSISPGPKKSIILLAFDSTYKVNYLDSNFTLIKKEAIPKISGKNLILTQALYLSDSSLLKIGYTYNDVGPSSYFQLCAKKAYIGQFSGLGEQLNNLQISVYPNPAYQTVTVLLHTINSSPEIELFNSKGVLVENLQINKLNDQTYTLNIEYLPEGAYILALTLNQLKYYHRVMVIK